MSGNRQMPREVTHLTCRSDDTLDRQRRIGLLVLATDQATEQAFRAMCTDEEVLFLTSRVTFTNPTTRENLRAMTDDLTRATSLLVPGARLDAIAYSCTSGTVAIGPDPLFERIRAARPDIDCTTPVTAAVHALKSLGVERFSLVSPYVDELNRAMADFFEERELGVSALASLHLESDYDMARISPEGLVETIAAADHGDAQAVFIPCTALRAYAAIDRLEAALGLPVVTSHQAMLWHVLELAGRRQPVAGYGRLLRQ